MIGLAVANLLLMFAIFDGKLANPAKQHRRLRSKSKEASLPHKHTSKAAVRSVVVGQAGQTGSLETAYEPLCASEDLSDTEQRKQVCSSQMIHDVLHTTPTRKVHRKRKLGLLLCWSTALCGITHVFCHEKNTGLP